MRADLFNHIQSLPIRFFDTNKHGDLMSRFTNDFENIQNAFNNSMLMIISSTLQLVLTFDDGHPFTNLNSAFDCDGILDVPNREETEGKIRQTIRCATSDSWTSEWIRGRAY